MARAEPDAPEGGAVPRIEKVLELRDHLTGAALDTALASLDLPDTGAVHLIVDVSAMTGYEGEARTRFVEWHRRNHARIAAVAIVGAKPIWRMVIHAMSLASRVPMKPVAGLAEARAWLAGR